MKTIHAVSLPPRVTVVSRRLVESLLPWFTRTLPPWDVNRQYTRENKALVWSKKVKKHWNEAKQVSLQLIKVNCVLMCISGRRQWHPTPGLLPGKSHGWRSLVGCSPWGRTESDTTEWRHFHFSLSCIGEGNGNPLQCSCLENPRDGGAWWAARLWGCTESDTTGVT